MEVLRIVLTIIFILVCIALVVLVLMHKGRSMEGRLVKITKVLAVLFMVFAIILNLNIF